MKFRKMTAAALAGFCTLVAAMPNSFAAPDTTTGSSATTQTKTTSESSGGQVGQAAKPGVISNDFITYQEDHKACFNHEVGGAFTLATKERGAIAQLFYGVTYDGKEAAYLHEADVAPLSNGFDSKTTQSSDSRRIITEVHTSDGAVVIRTESACGKGPYVTRQMQVTNTSQKPLAKVRLLLSLNPDTLDWENESGRVDADSAQVLINNVEKTQWVGVAAQPKPAFLTAEDVADVLDAEADPDWEEPSTSHTGNTAVQAGWELGPLEPGKSKTVEATFALADTEADLRKALTRQEFPAK